MQVRIIKIRGRNKATRRERLAVARDWMESHGWRLNDYTDELGSALFEREAGAPPLKWRDPTRWLPAPLWFQPRDWLAEALRQPRKIALTLGVGAAVTAAFVAVLHSTSLPVLGPNPSAVEQSGEQWLFVHADALNVREAPQAEAKIVAVLFRNQKVLVVSRKGDWARLNAPERGYAAAGFLRDHPAP